MYHLPSLQYALILITILVTSIAVTFFSVFDCLFIFTDFFSHAIVLFLDEIKFRFYASLIWMIYPVNGSHIELLLGNFIFNFDPLSKKVHLTIRLSVVQFSDRALQLRWVRNNTFYEICVVYKANPIG